MAKENIDIKSKLMKKNTDQEKKELEFISDIENPKAALFMEELLADNNTEDIKVEEQIAPIATASKGKNVLTKEILTENILSKTSILDLKLEDKEKAVEEAFRKNEGQDLNRPNLNLLMARTSGDGIGYKVGVANREEQLLKEINQLKYKNVKATISTSYEVIKLEEKLKNLYESSGSISKFNRSLIYRKGLEAAVKEIEQEIKLEKESWS